MRDPDAAYELRRERMARLLAASLMELVKDPVGEWLSPEVWTRLLRKADAVLLMTSHYGTREHRLAGKRLETNPDA